MKRLSSFPPGRILETQKLASCLRSQASRLGLSVATFASQRLAACLSGPTPHIPRLAACILILHRSLQFSPDVFLHTVLHTHALHPKPSVLLLTLHALVSRLRSLLTLDMVVGRLEIEDQGWVVDGLTSLILDNVEGDEETYIISLIRTINLTASSLSLDFSIPVSADATTVPLVPWSIYLSLTRDEAHKFLDWRSQRPTFPIYSRIFALLTTPTSGACVLDAQACKIFMMRELARLCDRNGGIWNQTGRRVFMTEDRCDKAFQEVMLAGRVLYEENDSGLTDRQAVLRPLLACLTGAYDTDRDGSTTVKPTVTKYVIEQIRKRELTLHSLALLALFRLACSDASASSTQMVRVSITAEIHTLLEHGLADSTDHDTIALGIVLAQIAGRECALSPEVTSELDAPNTVNGNRREYHTWFLNTFIDEKSSLLKSKRMLQSFVNALQLMVPFEAPAVLQLQGKAILGIQKHKAIVNEYVTLVKARLLELGLDHTLRNNPNSLNTPTRIPSSDPAQNSATNGASIADIATILSIYAQTGRVPTSLGQDSVFRQRWYKNTFLPSLLFGDPARQSPPLSKEAAAKFQEARHGLVEALYELKKVPPKLYEQYTEGRKGGAGRDTTAAVVMTTTVVPSSIIEASKKRKQSAEAVGSVGKKRGQQDNKENVGTVEPKSIERSLRKLAGDATASLLSHDHQLNESTIRLAAPTPAVATLKPIHNFQKSSLTEQYDKQLRSVAMVPLSRRLMSDSNSFAPHSATTSSSSYTLTQTCLPSPHPVAESISVTEKSLRVDLPARPVVDGASASCVKKQLLQKLGELRESKAQKE